LINKIEQMYVPVPALKFPSLILGEEKENKGTGTYGSYLIRLRKKRQ